MKFFSLGLIVFMFASLGKSAPPSYRYVKEIAPTLHTMTKGGYWQRYFPARGATPIPINEFLTEEVGVSSQKELNSMTDESRIELIEETRTKRIEWFNEFYPEPTEERMLEVLSEDSDLRARMTSYTYTFQAEHRDRTAKKMPMDEVGVATAFARSFGLAMFIKAIDSDMTQEKLKEKIGNFVNDEVPVIKYRGDGNTPYVEGRSKSTYRSLDRYLLRLNTVNHPPLPSDVQGDLWERGYNHPDVYPLFPLRVARGFISQEYSPTRVEEAGYDLAFLIDLLCEKCVIGNFIATILDAEADILDKLVAAEMGIEVDSEVFAERVALLNDKDNPTSLFQIVQMDRLGVPLEVTAELNYQARESVIASAHPDYKSFTDMHGKDIDEINKIATEIGELAFYLVHRNFVRSIKEVNPHQAPSAEQIDEISDENINWLTITPEHAPDVIFIKQQ